MRLEDTTTEQPHPFNTWIARLRQDSSVTQSEIDLERGPAETTQRGVESGKTPITRTTANKYSKAFTALQVDGAAKVMAYYDAFTRDQALTADAVGTAIEAVDTRQLHIRDGDTTVRLSPGLRVADDELRGHVIALFDSVPVRIVPSGTPVREGAVTIGVLGVGENVDHIFTGYPMPSEYSLPELARLIGHLGVESDALIHAAMCHILGARSDLMAQLYRGARLEVLGRAELGAGHADLPPFEVEHADGLRRAFRPFADARAAGLTIAEDRRLVNKVNTVGGTVGDLIASLYSDGAERIDILYPEWIGGGGIVDGRNEKALYTLAAVVPQSVLIFGELFVPASLHSRGLLWDAAQCDAVIRPEGGSRTAILCTANDEPTGFVTLPAVAADQQRGADQTDAAAVVDGAALRAAFASSTWRSRPAARRVLPVGVEVIPQPGGSERASGKALAVDLWATPHVFVMGTERSGVSTTLRTLIDSVTSMYTSEEAGFVVLDGRAGLVGQIDSLVERGYLQRDNYAISRAQADPLVKRIAAEIAERQPKDISTLTAEQISTREFVTRRELFVVVDGFDSLRSRQVGVQEGTLEWLAQVAAKHNLGVHFLVGADSRGITNWIGINKFSRMLAEEVPTQMILLRGLPSEGKVFPGEPIKFQAFPQPGRALWHRAGDTEETIIQIATSEGEARSTN